MLQRVLSPRQARCAPQKNYRSQIILSHGRPQIPHKNNQLARLAGPVPHEQRPHAEPERAVLRDLPRQHPDLVQRDILRGVEHGGQKGVPHIDEDRKQHPAKHADLAQEDAAVQRSQSERAAQRADPSDAHAQRDKRRRRGHRGHSERAAAARHGPQREPQARQRRRGRLRGPDSQHPAAAGPL
ncbi:hypothetical protein KL921_004627 [Ogataea angusta]|nr:hypothetical protein KL921_004627 [Ogataea angusta]KAG7827213.1 hypothetical protein KL920_004873 [Ogataea angusta]KAG7829367.1 hypothetical protein KL943_005380 [Ogataea angusta]KAG7842850.1 hypothetical protein KL941_004880 [Ogataea angusta]KAG7855141.1 hypothetical protein KL919_004908 [Ogataea angusta]